MEQKYQRYSEGLEALRAWSRVRFLGGKSYLRALPHFVIDLAAVLPPMLAGTLLLSKGHAPEWLQGLCVLWVLKPERVLEL